jgi:hypothetical protein
MDQAVVATFRIYNIPTWATDKKYGPTANKYWTGYISMRSIILKTPAVR